MQHYPDITMCLTIGGRPEVLERTLHSILPQASFAQIIAVNDYRDAASSAVFQRLCPTGLLIVPETQMGHHPIVDRMYSQVQTPYIFHGEDDWFFEQGLDLNRARTLLNADAAISSVCLRKIEDFPFDAQEVGKIVSGSAADIDYYRLDGLHEQWHGYTFNPHLIARETVQQIGAFAQFKKERHLSRHLRAQNKFTAFIKPGVCHHIGEVSMANPPAKSRWEAIRRKIFG